MFGESMTRGDARRLTCGTTLLTLGRGAVVARPQSSLGNAVAADVAGSQGSLGDAVAAHVVAVGQRHLGFGAAKALTPPDGSPFLPTFPVEGRVTGAVRGTSSLRAPRSDSSLLVALLDSDFADSRRIARPNVSSLAVLERRQLERSRLRRPPAQVALDRPASPFSALLRNFTSS